MADFNAKIDTACEEEDFEKADELQTSLEELQAKDEERVKKAKEILEKQPASSFFTFL